MNSGQSGLLDAVETIVLGPIYALIVATLFYVVFRIYALLRPEVRGPFEDTMDSIWTGLHISYDLFRLASTLKTLVAFLVIGAVIVGAVMRLLDGGHGGMRR